MFLDSFRDLLTYECEFQVEQNVKNARGEPVKSWVKVQDSLVGIWASNSNETNLNDKFINQFVGMIVADPNELTFIPTNKHRAIIDSVIYYIEGPDDIAFQNEVYLLKYRRENG